jgi:hypothetical protein
MSRSSRSKSRGTNAHECVAARIRARRKSKCFCLYESHILYIKLNFAEINRYFNSNFSGVDNMQRFVLKTDAFNVRQITHFRCRFNQRSRCMAVCLPTVKLCAIKGTTFNCIASPSEIRVLYRRVARSRRQASNNNTILLPVVTRCEVFWK